MTIGTKFFVRLETFASGRFWAVAFQVNQADPRHAPPHHQNGRTWAIVIALGVGFASWQLHLLPPSVFVFNDDFGYFRSIVETAQHGRPWTDDWLEPWSSSLSALCAVIWRWSGSFLFATRTVQFVSIACGCAVAAAIFVRRGYPVIFSALLAIFLFSFPTVFWKNLEFTGFFLNTALLVVAIYSAQQKRWLCFLVCVLAAIANRQSAVAWLAVPAAEAVLSFAPRPNRRRAFLPTVVLACGVAAYALCGQLMNQTHAQKVMTTAMWHSLQLSTFGQQAVLCLLTAVAMFGLGNFAVCGLSAQATGRLGAPRATLIKRVVILGGLIVLLLATLRLPWRMQFEHGLFTTAWSSAYIALLVSCSAAGWVLGPLSCDIRLLAGVAGCTALTSLRGAVWDYYLVDLALFAFYAAHQERVTSGTSGAPLDTRAVNTRRGILALLLLGSLPFHLAYSRLSKQNLDDAFARATLAEQGLHAGTLDITEISFAPFGYIGWHLYPYFVSTDGADNRYIADFMGYLKPTCVDIETRSAKSFHAESEPNPFIATGTFTIGKHRDVQFILRRRPVDTPPALRIDPSRFKLGYFPQNDAEWIRLLEKEADE